MVEAGWMVHGSILSRSDPCRQISDSEVGANKTDDRGDLATAPPSNSRHGGCFSLKGHNDLGPFDRIGGLPWAAFPATFESWLCSPRSRSPRAARREKDSSRKHRHSHA